MWDKVTILHYKKLKTSEINTEMEISATHRGKLRGWRWIECVPRWRILIQKRWQVPVTRAKKPWAFIQRSNLWPNPTHYEILEDRRHFCALRILSSCTQFINCEIEVRRLMKLAKWVRSCLNPISGFHRIWDFGSEG